MKKVLFAVIVLLAAVSCGTKTGEKEKPLAGHVIIIGLDGWGSWCMDKGEAPFIREMMKEGSWTLSKRALIPSSSQPNWIAMMTGSPFEFGILADGEEPFIEPLVRTEHNTPPTFFHLLKQVRPEAETGVVCEWHYFVECADPYCLDTKILIDNPIDNPDSVVEESVNYIKEKKPVLCFVHIDALDHMGHTYGQGSTEYYAELTKVDERVRKIVEGIKEAGIYDDSIIIVTSDHGHKEYSHGGHSMLELETPLVVWGKGIKKNHEITGTVAQYDIAATVGEILRLDTPQNSRGVPVDIFE